MSAPSGSNNANAGGTGRVPKRGASDVDEDDVDGDNDVASGMGSAAGPSKARKTARHAAFNEDQDATVSCSACALIMGSS